jgi:regulator of sigma D
VFAEVHAKVSGSQQISDQWTVKRKKFSELAVSELTKNVSGLAIS